MRQAKIQVKYDDATREIVIRVVGRDNKHTDARMTLDDADEFALNLVQALDKVRSENITH